jgi:AraC family transcriptional regulator of adaptative response/methylated-DNA-[protein]-cysteine methyltransferase
MWDFWWMNTKSNDPRPQTVNDYDRIARAIEYISMYAMEQPTLEEVAAHVCLSPYHFQRLFTQWSGVSPKKFLQFLTVQNARQRLHEDRDLLSTAWEVGLSGSGRLHDLFVHMEGVTPGIYKARGAGIRIVYGLHESPFGEYLVATTEKGICKLAFTGGDAAATIAELQEEWPRAECVFDPGTTLKTARSLFGGNEQDVLRLWVKGSPFQIKVWEALLRIPEGALASYGQVAKAIGNPGAVRAVGTAIGQNPVAFLIPCHRVIRRAGGIGQYRWGSTRKQAIIGWEAAHANRAAV